MARRNSVLDAIKAFNLAYDTVDKVGNDLQLADIANSKAVESDGFMPDETRKLSEAAASAQSATYDPDTQKYTFAAKQADDQVGPPELQTFAKQGVTDFLGKRTAGTLTEPQQDRARMQAMAGVMGKTDPMKAMAMRMQLSTSDRQDKMDARQVKVNDRQDAMWARDDSAYADEQAWKTGRQKLMDDSVLTKGANDHEAAVLAHQQAVTAWSDNGEQGLPPVAPVRAAITPAERLSAWVPLMQHDYKHGKLTTEGAFNFQQQIKKLDTENYTKAIMSAHAGADAATVTKLFNEAGTKIPEGSLVINDGVDKAGMPVRIMEYTDPQTGQKMTINTGAETAMLGKLHELHQDFFAGKSDQRGDANLVLSQNQDKRGAANLVLSQNQDKRAQNSANQSDADKKAAAKEVKDTAQAAVDIFVEQNPDATPAQINAVRKGVIAATPKDQPYKLEYGEVAQAFGEPAMDPDGKPIVDLMTGKPTINRNLEKEKEFFQWMKSNNIKDTNKGLLEYRGAPNAAKKIASDPAAIAIRDNTKLTDAQKRAELQKLGYK